MSVTLGLRGAGGDEVQLLLVRREELDGTIVELAEGLDLRVVAMDPVLALACHVGFEVLGHEVGEVHGVVRFANWSRHYNQYENKIRALSAYDPILDRSNSVATRSRLLLSSK